MADLSKINVAGSEYNIKDVAGRQSVADHVSDETAHTDLFAAKVNTADIVNDDTTGGATVPASAEIVKAHGTSISELAQKSDYLYAGVDLTTKHATEIAGYSDVWAWLHARVAAVNFKGIRVGDYIPVVMGSDTLQMQVAGIDSYYNTGDTAIAHHIDFVSKDCRGATLKWNLTDVNQGFVGNAHPVSSNAGLTVVQSDKGELFSTAVSNTDGTYVFTYDSTAASWKYNSTAVNLATTYGLTVTGTPANGDTITCYYVYANGSPFKTSNAYDVLNLGSAAAGVSWYSELPAALKPYIIEKRFFAPTRYNVSSNLSSDNSWTWGNLGKLWLPFECEVYSAPVWGGTGVGNGFSAQYPIFEGGVSKRIKNGGESLAYWWLASAYAGSLTHACGVHRYGFAGYFAASTALRAPVCFRFR